MPYVSFTLFNIIYIIRIKEYRYFTSFEGFCPISAYPVEPAANQNRPINT